MPTRPDASLEQLRKLAKELLKAHKTKDPKAAERFRRHRPSAASPALHDAQLVIAREYGFASWPLLKRYVSALSDWPPPHTQVELVQKRFRRTLSLGPPATVLDLVGRQAEDLLDGFRARDPATAVELRNHHPALAGRSGEQLFGAEFSIEEARLVAARGHGFASWGDVEAAADRNLDASFEAAVDALVSGDLESLAAALQAEPELARRRSALGHRATLLHYVAANGVEIRRQSTPTNAVAIARALLDAGADVDALAATYGGGSSQTTLCLLVTSHHPAQAGVQAELTEALLDAGAAIDGLDGDSAPLESALAFGYVDTAEVLARRGARIGNVVTAAGLGRVEVMKEFFDEAGAFAGAAHTDPFGRTTANPVEILGRAFLAACHHGRLEAARLLLQHGADIATRGPQNFTALHRAAFEAKVGTVEFLLELGAPLELTNDYDATVLDAAVWAAVRSRARAADYQRILERLLAAGADVAAVSPFPTGDATIDDLLRS
ncbi:MAG: ankyrin repeat domain-containing protein [Planctomycetota bacterium]